MTEITPQVLLHGRTGEILMNWLNRLRGYCGALRTTDSQKRLNSSKRRAATVLALEQLEDRAVPAYIATVVGTTATFTGDGAGDTLTFSRGTGGNSGLLMHNRFSSGDAGFASDFDFVSGDGATVTTFAADAANTVVVNTGGGNDTVNVGTATIAAGTLLATFQVNNLGQDGDTLVVDDSASATGKTYNETSISISAPGINVIRGGAGYSGGVVLRTSSARDTVNLTSVATVGVFIEPVSFFTGDGDDTINIDPTSNSLDTFGQTITVDAGTGTDDGLFVNDVADNTANDYTITATTVQRSGGININYNATVERLRLDAGQGSDDIVVDYSGGALTAELSPRGGGGTNLLTLTNGTFGILTHSYVNATNGLAQITGQPVIGYESIQSIADNLIITGRIFNFSNANDVVTVENDAGGQLNLSQISSVSTSPLTTFTNPGSLTIQLDGGGAGDDSITFNAFEPAFNANILVNAGDGNDDITLNATTGTTNAYNLNGQGGDDTLAIDFTTADIDRLISFNGGAGGNDALTLQNGTVTSVAHTFLSATDGNIQVNANPLINYTGLDPILDELIATNRIFTFANGDDQITLSDDLAAAAGISVIASAGTSETVTFANPTGTLTINADNGGTGNDSITVSALEAGFVAPITLNGGDGNDEFTVRPQVGAELNVNGDAPGVAPGDTLTVILAGAEGGTLVPAGSGAGTFGFSNRQDVNFTGIETLASPAIYAVGAGRGSRVKVYNADGTLRFNIAAFGPNYQGGVRVATGDINNDGVEDIIAGSATRPIVKVFDGQTGALVRSFLAFGARARGGVFVGAGDVNNDTFDDIIVGKGAGGPRVVVFSGQGNAVLRSFRAYDPSFRGGVTVAGGDVNNDTFDDIITGQGGDVSVGARARVNVFSGLDSSLLRSFFAFGAAFTGGVFVGAGDTNNDSFDDIIVAQGAGGTPRVKLFSGQNHVVLQNFFAYASGFRGGVRVAGLDIDGDLGADILTGAGPGGGPHVKAFDGLTLAQLESFFAFNQGFTGGIYVG
jgi:fibronectin-binding autotransporter adhesin